MIGDRNRVKVAVVGHAGDGNMHPTLVYDPADADEFARARVAFDEILELGLGLGGTVTGEHGIGKIKREWLAREIGPVGPSGAPRHQAGAGPGQPVQPGLDVRYGIARNPIWRSTLSTYSPTSSCRGGTSIR